MTLSPPKPPWFPRHRRKILFFSGLAGLAFETTLNAFGIPADPALLVIFTGMMGLTAFIEGRDKDE